LRATGNRAWVGIGDFKAPIIGRVSMDVITLDVTEVAENLSHVGALVEMMVVRYFEPKL
jgi:alanine racemase